MGHEEHGGTWHMDAAQLDTQRKKGEAILKTSSTVYSTNRSSSSTRPAKLQLDRAEKNPTSRSNKFKMLRGEGSQAALGRKQRAEKARRMRERMSIDEGLEYVRSREERNQQMEERHVSSEERSESERLREERRTKKRNDAISSESEQGEFEIGVNLVQEGSGSPSEEGSDETESERKEKRLNQRKRMSSPCTKSTYNALFSMDFVETKYPHDDTMRDLGIFEDVELVLKNMQLGSSSLTAWSLTRS
ncbi:unnamed protein product [Microthlaspi erraticum]|uniref:Arabidopsis retrotransposon Orf1 C-terminal domain-containing protein n=1 Tax=Microthlaspi erraticum TaxID=1685480 RepID=A0A6D2KHS8_9BRAS|nr:unnamed protein product [Microthlaspi erraticum]